MFTLKEVNEIAKDLLPGYLGVNITHLDETEVWAELEVKKFHLAPNSFLHAASIIALADSACGTGCICNLPEGASGFTTVELKSNHLGTVREGIIDCVAKAVHKGRTTQVWDAIVNNKESGKTLALFRCTQMILYSSPAA